MDKFIAEFDLARVGDLMVSDKRGVAHQEDMDYRIKYNGAYFDNYNSREGTAIARKLNDGRIGFVNRHVGEQDVLDIGIGSGEFITSRGKHITFGFDINPVGIEWLQKNKLLRGDFESFSAFTFWDVIEHIPDPNDYFKHIKEGSFLFTSLPIFKRLSDVPYSKHYKPGEHLYYWTEKGFVDWMALYGFRLLEKSDFETRAGRESITSFAFQR